MAASIGFDQVVAEVAIDVTDSVKDARVFPTGADVCGADSLAAPLCKGVGRPVEELRCRRGVDDKGVVFDTGHVWPLSGGLLRRGKKSHAETDPSKWVCLGVEMDA